MLDKIVLGTAQLGLDYGINNIGVRPLLNESLEILEFTFSNGVRMVDTAEAYGNAIDIIGNYHRQSKNKFSIISKFKSKQSNYTDILFSLERLQVSSYDIFMYHSFADFENGKSGELMTRLKEENYLKKIGISVYGNAELQKAVDSKYIDVIQVPFNLLDNEFQKGNLLKLAKQHNKEIHVRSVFLQGLFFMEKDLIPEKLQGLFNDLLNLQMISKEHHLTIESLALSYALSKEYIDKVIIGIDSIEQLRRNLYASTIAGDKTAFSRIDKIAIENVELLNPAKW